MNRYVVISEYRRPGEPIDLPQNAVGVGVRPTSGSEFLRVTYLDPVVPITLGSSAEKRVNVDKQ